MSPDQTGGQTAAPKICVRCGHDCSGRKRVRDSSGRYVCQECLDKAHAARAAARARAAPETPPSDDGTIPLATDDGPGPQVVRDTASESKPCPLCGTGMRKSDAICVECGYSRETGKRLDGAGAAVKSKRAKTAKCQKCGYSLAGLRSMVCPDCGHKNRVENRWWIDRAREKRDTRWEYRKPLLMLVIGGGLTALILVLTGRDAAGYGLELAIKLPFGIAVFWMCCLIWIGFDAPIGLTLLRLAGIYAVVDLVSLILAFVLLPIPIIGVYGLVVIAATVYIGLLSDMLEMDLQDAFIVGLITFAVRMIAWFLLVAYGVI